MPAAGSQRYLVVGTAGHIDHGKTSLIRALTGVDLDTLPEEQSRQITIALGFTHLDLAQGCTVSFVDVPGHERLVRTMVAGASGIDAALLCVSAVEGVMPQTREHLDILGLLGVTQGLVALTFADMVDEELLELATEEVTEIIEASPLCGAPVIPFSSETGQGKGKLLEALSSLAGRNRHLDAPFRLPVDRVFTRHGHGTVVTGTVASGSLEVGEEVEILPYGVKARVRGLQVHGEQVKATRAGLRTAMNLPVALDDVERGCEVARPDTVNVTRVVDLSYRHLPGAPAMEDDSEVRFLVGTSEVVARVRPLGASRIPPDGTPPGEAWDGFLQVRLPHPVPCMPGDRYVLRRASPVVTLGGGVVLDPWARPVRHRGRDESGRQLRRLKDGDRGVFLERAGLAGLPLSEARRRGALPAPGEGWGAVVGDRVWHAEALALLEEAVTEALGRHHEARRLSPGAHRKELQAGRLKALGDRSLEGLLDHMVAGGRLERRAGRYCLAGFQVTLDGPLQAARARALEAAREAGFTMLSVQDLVSTAAHPEAEDLLHHLQEAGELVRVGSFLGHRSVLDHLVATVKSWLAEDGSFTPTEAKERLGLTRKHLIPLLEWLDGVRVTRRVGDSRRAFS